MSKMKQEPNENNLYETHLRNVYGTPLFPALFTLVIAAAPEWSNLYFIIFGMVTLVLSIRVLFGYFRNKHRDWRWHALTGVITYDTLGFMCLIPFWRVLGEKLWQFVLLVILYLLCIGISHYFRKAIFEGLFLLRRTMFSKIFYTVGFALIGLNGGGTYGYARMLQEMYDYHTVMLILSGGLFPFGLWVTLGFHSLWVRVENPKYGAEP